RVDNELSEVKSVAPGAGAAGTASVKLLLAAGAADVVVADIAGVVHRGRDGLEGQLLWLAQPTNPPDFTRALRGGGRGGHTKRRELPGTLKEAVVGAGVFIGVSAPRVIDGTDVGAMADDAIVF